MTIAIPFLESRDFRLDGLDIDRRRGTLTVTGAITMPVAAGETAVEAFHDEAHAQDRDNDDWHLEMLDCDEGPEVAWASFHLTARSPAAIAELDRLLAARTPWGGGATALLAH